jgi:hypothetical protein
MLYKNNNTLTDYKMRIGQSRLQQNIVPLMRNLPSSRWMLFIGSFLIVPLAFIPWLRGIVQCQTISFGSSCQYIASVNPLSTYLDFLISSNAESARLVSFHAVILTGCVAPGILCSIWVHGRIQTWGQRIGVLSLSIWLVFITLASINTTNWIYKNGGHDYIFITQVVPVTGFYLQVFALGILWMGTILVWFELLSNKVIASGLTVQLLSPFEYLGAALVSIGGICWFTGYYGIYWLLPSDCPPTPLFGSAQCVNRLSGQRGYELIVQNFPLPYQGILIDLSYWMLGAIVVFAGITLLIALWVRRSFTMDIPWIGGWIVCLGGMTAISYWGMRQLAVLFPEDQWTNGLSTTIFGMVCIAIGLFIRWATVVNQS